MSSQNTEMSSMVTPSVPMVNPMSLQGRTVIVTGAGQGIGRAVADLTVGLGGNVILLDMNGSALAQARKQLGEDRTLAVVGNVIEEGVAEMVVNRAVERFGFVDGLVNNAGLSRPAMMERMDLVKWRHVLEVHLTGSFLFMQAVGRRAIAAHKAETGRPCSIVNVSSDAGVQGTVGQVNYSAAKCGILGVTMSAAREWARYGIRVNTAVFGVVDTPMTEVVRGDQFRETYLAKIPMARWGHVAEAANLICFLLSGASSYVTGQHISSNGGSQMSA